MVNFPCSSLSTPSPTTQGSVALPHSRPSTSGATPPAAHLTRNGLNNPYERAQQASNECGVDRVGRVYAGVGIAWYHIGSIVGTDGFDSAVV